MIIENGTIEFKDKTLGGIDPETGYPRRPTDARWGNPLPCQYIPASGSLLARTAQGERITRQNYTVLLDARPLPESEQVRLTDGMGRCLGEYSLIAPPERLEAVDQIKITI